MKKAKMALIISLLAVPFSAGAAGWSMPAAQGLPQATIYNIITSLLMWLLSIFGILGIIGFVISGIMYLTSAGSPKTLESAKNAMKYSIIGVLVGLSGWILISAINSALRGYSYF